MKSWKTTVTGIGAIITAIVGATTGVVNNTPVDWTSIIAAVMARVGLITAKDANVTGGTKQQ